MLEKYLKVNAQRCIKLFTLHESFRMFSIVLDKLAKVGVYVRLRTYVAAVHVDLGLANNAFGVINTYV